MNHCKCPTLSSLYKEHASPSRIFQREMQEETLQLQTPELQQHEWQHRTAATRCVWGGITFAGTVKWDGNRWGGKDTNKLSTDNIQESSLCLQPNSGLGFWEEKWRWMWPTASAWWRGEPCRAAGPELIPSLGQKCGWHWEPGAVSLNLIALGGLLIQELVEQANF